VLARLAASLLAARLPEHGRGALPRQAAHVGAVSAAPMQCRLLHCSSWRSQRGRRPNPAGRCSWMPREIKDPGRIRMRADATRPGAVQPDDLVPTACYASPLEEGASPITETSPCRQFTSTRGLVRCCNRIRSSGLAWLAQARRSRRTAFSVSPRARRCIAAPASCCARLSASIASFRSARQRRQVAAPASTARQIGQCFMTSLHVSR